MSQDVPYGPRGCESLTSPGFLSFLGGVSEVLALRVKGNMRRALRFGRMLLFLSVIVVDGFRFRAQRLRVEVSTTCTCLLPAACHELQYLSPKTGVWLAWVKSVNPKPLTLIEPKTQNPKTFEFITPLNIGRQIDRSVDRQIDRQIDNQITRQLDKQITRQMDGWITR